MATEKRLIYAEDFHAYLEGIRQDYLEEDTLSSNFAAEVIETVQDEYLANAPTADAVEVVRCKDCRFFDSKDGFSNYVCRRHCGLVLVTKETFCSYGESKTDG